MTRRFKDVQHDPVTDEYYCELGGPGSPIVSHHDIHVLRKFLDFLENRMEVTNARVKQKSQRVAAAGERRWEAD